MQKNHVSLADYLPPDSPLVPLLQTCPLLPADSADGFIRAFNQGRAFAKTVLHVPDSAHDPAPLQEGSRVRIENLQASAAMNGRTGVICSAFNRESGRWTVEVDADGASLTCRLSIRPANLKAIQTSSADAIPNFASQWMDEDGRVWAREVDFLRQCPKGHALTKFHRDVFDVNAKQLLCRICHTTCLCNSDCAAEWNVCSVVSGCCFGYAVCSSCASASSVAAAPSTGADDHVRTQVGDDLRISVKIACCQSA